MAYNPKSAKNLKRLPKGVSGNPAGRLPDVLSNKIKQLTASELAEIANLIVKGDFESLKNIADIKTSKATVIQIMVARVAVKVIAKGDMHSLDVLLNRLVGKVKDKVEIVDEKNAPRVIVSIPSNGREVKKS